MNSKKLISNVMLLLTACIWGVAFVAQRVGMDYIGPLTFNFVRFLIGAIILIPVILVLDDTKKRQAAKNNLPYEKMSPNEKKMTILGGVLCGLALCGGSLLQQFGISYTTVGKAGFITAFYIIIVPLLGILFKKKVSALVWVSVALAMIGFYFLCMTEGFSLGIGDTLVLLCAVVFSLHILIIDYFAPKGDGVKISCIQFGVCALICGIGAFIFETPRLSDIIAGYVPVLYAGVLSCGIAYTLQVVAQKNTDPTISSLILSLESVVAVIAGWLILGQNMSMREILGCIIVFAAIILAQLPDKKSKE